VGEAEAGEEGWAGLGVEEGNGGGWGCRGGLICRLNKRLDS